MKSTITQQWHGAEVKVQGKKVVGKSAYEIGLVVEGQAKLLAPKDTGYLAASITTQASDGTGTMPESPSKYGPGGGKGYSDFEMTIQIPREENEVYVGTPLEYAPHMEFGTMKTPAQPFLRPALDLAMGKVLTIVQNKAKFYFKEYLK